MSMLSRIFKARRDEFQELEALKEEFSRGQQRVRGAARRLSRAAEQISRQHREEELAEFVGRMRTHGAAE